MMSNTVNLPSYEEATTAYNTAQEVQREKESGIIDRRYIKGIPGILKFAELILSLIGYICVEVTICAGFAATFGYFKFVAMTSFMVTLIMYILLLFKLNTRILRCECVNWPFFELSFYAVIILFYFFADLFMALHSCAPGHTAAAVFGFTCLGVYIADAVFAFRVWWQARQQAVHGPNTPTSPGGIDPKY